MLNIHDCQTAGAHIFMGRDGAKAIYHRVNTWDALVEALEYLRRNYLFSNEDTAMVNAALAAAKEEK